MPATALAAGMSNDMSGAKPMIAVNDQIVHGKTVTIAEVETPRDGFLVIHASKDGKPVAPQHVGYAPVKAGVDQSVKVKLDETPKPGTTYIAMLHDDTGVKGKLEFGPGHTDVDKPMMRDGKVVEKAFKIEKVETRPSTAALRATPPAADRRSAPIHLLDRRGDAQQPAVVTVARHQHQPGRQAAIARQRQRDRGQIEEIADGGVAQQHGVARHEDLRIGHLVDARRHGRRGRHHQRVDIGEPRIHLADQARRARARR